METAGAKRAPSRWQGAVSAGRLGAVCLLALSAAGCQGYAGTQVAGWVISDPAQAHPIEVTQRPVAVNLAVPRGAPGLSHAQEGDVRDFIQRYKKEGLGHLVVHAPSGGPNELAAMRAVDGVRDELIAARIKRDAVELRPYDAGANPVAPVKLSFVKYVAQGPDCGIWTTNLARSPNNLNYPNFGCANQHNLAAMVANPRDLVVPRSETPRSSDRRDTVLQKYIKGEPTGAQKSQDDRTTISDIGSN